MTSFVSSNFIPINTDGRSLVSELVGNFEIIAYDVEVSLGEYMSTGQQKAFYVIRTL